MATVYKHTLTTSAGKNKEYLILLFGSDLISDGPRLRAWKIAMWLHKKKKQLLVVSCLFSGSIYDGLRVPFLWTTYSSGGS